MGLNFSPYEVICRRHGKAAPDFYEHARDFGFGLEVMDKTSALACGMITKLVSLHLNYICVLPVESNLIM
jgi:hypothetical protein